MEPEEPVSIEEAARLSRQADEVLWRAGDLGPLKLHSDQVAVYALMLAAFAAGAARFVLEIARRWGKTWFLVTVAIETGIKNPGCRIVYGAPTLSDLEKFIIPTLEAITEDAPHGLRWKFNQRTMKFGCENGSYIQLFGCDDKRKANRGRGTGAILIIVDEAGFIPILGYVIRSVLRPQLFHSNGVTLLGSTPAEEPDHDFTRMAELAEVNGAYANRTVYDNPLKTQEEIEGYIATDAKDEGLSPEDYVKTDHFRREYRAERVIDKRLVVVQEWEAARSAVVQRVPRPEFFDGYVALDPGGHDPHALLFMYWDFRNARLVVEGEVLLRDSENSAQIVEAAKAMEKQLWGVETYDGTLRAAIENRDELAKFVPDWMHEILSSKSAPQQPYLRVMDVNSILSKDLYQLHKMAFITTAKDDKEAAVNNLRVLIREGKLVVSPDCPNLDRHLRTTTWKDHRRKEYARKAGEHGDLVDALVYGLRNVDRARNPFPVEWRQPTPIAAAQEKQRQEDASRAILGDSRLARRLMRTRGR